MQNVETKKPQIKKTPEQIKLWADKKAATKEKRLSQLCITFELKIHRSSCTSAALNYLNQLFVEAKWFYNNILRSDDVFAYDFKSKTRNNIPLQQRTYYCPECGYTNDRDIHAAMNMVVINDFKLRMEHAEYTPVEIQTSARQISDFVDAYLPGKFVSLKQETMFAKTLNILA